MENYLLSPKEKKNRRWRSIKCFFQRKDEHRLPSGDLKYFANILDGGTDDEQDHTTVNMSHSGSGSNPYSVDESFDSLAAAQRERRPKSFTPPRNSRKGIASKGRSNREMLDNLAHDRPFTTGTFAQLHLPTMRFGRMDPAGGGASSLSSQSSKTSSSSSVRNKGTTRHWTDEPLDTSDLGMEVIMFQEDDADDDPKDGIFLSFQSPATLKVSPSTGSTPAPRKLSGSQKVKSETEKSSTPPPPPNSSFSSYTASFPIDASSPGNPAVRTEYFVPESPGLSQVSESVTWVSHDDDDADGRPVKEIVFPTLDDTATAGDDDFGLDNDTTTTETDRAETDRITMAGSVRDAIFAQFERETRARPVPVPVPVLNNNRVAVALSPSRSLRMRTSSRTIPSLPESVVPPPSPLLPEVPQRSLLRQTSGSQISTRNSWTLSDSSSPPSTLAAKTFSTAFLKRKSAFTGEDLLLAEAESFAEFLEEGPPITSKSSLVSGRKTNTTASTTSSFASIVSQRAISTEERLLIALTDSMDSNELSRPVGTAFPLTKRAAAAAHRGGGMHNSTETSQSNATSTSRASSELFSKSLSFDASFEDHSASSSATSLSSAASSNADERPTSLPGSLNYTPRPLRHDHNAAYCGGIFAESTPDEFFDDELTLRSEDFLPPPPPSPSPPSRMYSKSRSSKPLHQQHVREDTTPLLLDQVGKDLLATVQDLAREGSSAMMQLLRPLK
jgi:hypothetical protein